MKAYKIEILIIDFDQLGKFEIKNQIEAASYPNDCIAPEVKFIKEIDIGEWHDEHPLNLKATAEDEYKRLFGAPWIKM